MGLTSFLLLSSVALAITAQAQNCPVPAAGPNMNLKGTDILQNTFPDGTTVSFVCDVGYQTAGGSPLITCNAGSWSPVRLKCERKNCGSAGEVSHGQIDYPQGTLFGDTAVIICDQGYQLVGQRQLTCGKDAWEGRLPRCEAVTCRPPPMIEHGNYDPKKEEYYEYGEVVQYSCQNLYTLNGSKSLTCSENGNFMPDPPQCILVECEDPKIENAVRIEGPPPPYRHKYAVTYQCKSGYNMIGKGTLVCGINGRWSSELPQCQSVECEDPTIENAVRIEGPPPPYRPQATVTYQCKSGYNMIGKGTLVCGINGRWSSELPQCQSSVTPDPNGKSDSRTGMIVAVLFSVVGVILTVIGCVCYHCGLWPFNGKKQGSQRNAEKETPKDDEALQLA
ncbi:membrane cofactor protein-like isoform X9 [Lates japonicus]